MLASRLAENASTSILLLEAGPDYPDPANLPDEIKFGRTRFAEAPDSEHNWALRGTIAEEQGEIHATRLEPDNVFRARLSAVASHELATSLYK